MIKTARFQDCREKRKIPKNLDLSHCNKLWKIRNISQASRKVIPRRISTYGTLATEKDIL